MEEYIRRRSYLSTKLERARAKAQGLEEPVDRIMVEMLDEQLNELRFEINSCADDIMTLCEAEDAEAHQSTFAEMFDIFDDVKYVLRTKQATITTTTNNQQGASFGGSRNHGNNFVKLPKIDLPSFSGDILEWTAFADLYKATVHSQLLQPAVKLQYLRGALKGEALKLIQDYSISDANYLAAWNVLQKRYQNDRELVRSQILKFVNQPHLKEKNVIGLRSLLDTSTSCVLALKNMGYEAAVDEQNYWITFLLMERLDPETRELWESKLGRNNMPKWSDLIEFLDDRVSILSSSTKDVKLTAPKKNFMEKKNISAHQATTSIVCPVCNENHFTYQCQKFIDMSVDNRKKSVSEKKLCMNCLRSGHDVTKCSWGGSCRKCKLKHNTLLHSNAAAAAPPADSVSAHTVSASNRALMATALISIEDSFGESREFRALLDPGADVSFVSENVAQELHLKRKRTDVVISGVGATSAGSAKSIVELSLRSKIDDTFQMIVSAYVLPKVTSLLPKNEVSLEEFSHLKNVILADPTFCIPGTIDVLLGADVFYDILRDGRITGKEGHPIGQQTVWGFVVGGKCPSQGIPQSITVHHANCDAIDAMQKFWELEEIPRKPFLTPEDQECEDHFVATHSRDKSGRYVVRLPFRKDVPPLGVSVNMAEKRLRMMERRLGSNKNLKDKYIKFMREYLDLGHMELVPDDEINKPPDQVYYLPHHAVIKEESSTTKLRVVFDASAKTSSKISLNDRLMVGPKLQDDLFDLLIGFRLWPISMKADIAKMFRQIWVHMLDCDFQRILWRESPEDPIRHYRLLTVTYGTSVAPYLAKRILLQLAEDEIMTFPEAAQILKNFLYMDDLMKSEKGIERAIFLQQQLIQLLKRGGMDLRKWVSNSTELLEAVPAEMRETSLPLRLDESDTIKTLGLSYHPLSDCFKFSVSVSSDRETISKRTISSEIGKVYDPTGWLAPVTIAAKILFQQLWKANLSWDDNVGPAIELRWRSYHGSLTDIEDIRIPRCLLPSTRGRFQLAGFSDASELAYGAVIYIKDLDEVDGVPHILAAKTKVAPIKQVSLPRLELCAAVLLARLLDAVTYAIKCQAEEVFAWSDSTIVLHWLQSHPGRWKTFVANRVSEVQEILPSKWWHHVPGHENPADCISRGIMASELRDHPLWWHGPSWLQKFPQGCDAQHPPLCIDVNFDIEEKVCTSSHHANANDVDFSLLHKYSSLPRLLRVTALLLRFGRCSKRRGNQRRLGPITVTELRDALSCWIRLVQKHEFQEECHSFQKAKALDPNSKILPLNPFIDSESIIRVGGRLRNSNLSTNQKHPILLPKKHRLVDLIISHEHLVSLHAGPQMLLACLHRKYWILGARDLVRRYVRQCVICCKNRTEVTNQMMGDLPATRVNPSRPFMRTGVDYAGPVTLRVIKGKGHKFYKGYIAIFVCYATRAIHLELVTGLSSEAFAAALKRFSGRRGRPSDLFCDNGTTFVGAQKELECTRKPEFKKRVEGFLADESVRFHYNPPSAPHFGGIWEAGIKSVKHHLRRVLGNLILNYEEFTTLLIQIEACLNSRPISPLTSDPSDLLPLTPGHFLIGDALTSIPEPSYLDENISCKNRWKLVQKAYQDFWKRWSSEYLTRLQQRPKWMQPKPNVAVDTLVLVKDGRFPPLKWKLARVMELHPGTDDLVRVVTLRTSDGLVKRPVAKICPLPLC